MLLCPVDHRTKEGFGGIKNPKKTEMEPGRKRRLGGGKECGGGQGGFVAEKEVPKGEW